MRRPCLLWHSAKYSGSNSIIYHRVWSNPACFRTPCIASLGPISYTQTVKAHSKDKPWITERFKQSNCVRGPGNEVIIMEYYCKWRKVANRLGSSLHVQDILSTTNGSTRSRQLPGLVADGKESSGLQEGFYGSTGAVSQSHQWGQYGTTCRQNQCLLPVCVWSPAPSDWRLPISDHGVWCSGHACHLSGRDGASTGPFQFQEVDWARQDTYLGATRLRPLPGRSSLCNLQQLYLGRICPQPVEDRTHNSPLQEEATDTNIIRSKTCVHHSDH